MYVKLIQRAADDLGLSVGTLTVLGAIVLACGVRGSARVTAPAIAAATNLNKRTVLNALKRLEDRGYLHRTRGPRRNGTIVVIDVEN